MAQQGAWFEGKPEMLGWARALEFNSAYYLGKIQKARQYGRQGMAAVVHGQQDEAGAAAATEAALQEALFGNARVARQRAAEALRLSKGRDVQYGAALALAFAGDLAQAQALTDDLAARFPRVRLSGTITCPRFTRNLRLAARIPRRRLSSCRSPSPTSWGDHRQAFRL